MIGPYRTEDAPSYDLRIFIAGDLGAAKSICRAYCDEVGFCVTVTPTSYIYTGGEETGVIVGLIHYPRFRHDDPEAELWDRALTLADRLREGLGQESYSIQGPEWTQWRSWRAADAMTRDKDAARRAETPQEAPVPNSTRKPGPSGIAQIPDEGPSHV